MKFSSLLKLAFMSTDIKAETKEDAFREIVSRFSLKHQKIALDKIIERENQSSTGVGEGCAIPHARLENISEVYFFVGVSRKGIDFKSIDNKPVHLIFLFLTPLSETATHLKVLSRISRIIKDANLVKRLTEASDNQELFQIMLLQRSEKESYISLTVDQVFQELSTGYKGLTEEDASSRLKEYGPNLLKQKKGSPLLKKFIYNFVNLLALLMWAGAALAFTIDLSTIGWAIILVIIINALFSFWQEFKAEKAIEALRDLIPSFARVIRNGKEEKVHSANVVPGDVVIFDEGDNIPADSRLITTHELRVDNSVFSGESRPGYKTSDMFHHTEEFVWTEMPNLVFAGTSVVSGNGSAVIIATGMSTEIGKIATLTQSVKEELSPLQKEINKLTKIIAVVASALGLVFLFIGTWVAHLSLAASILFALGIILGNVPEGLLPTVTLSLAVAVQRMSKRNVLIKKLSSVETLGSTNVICTDKTGTLTTNQISVRKIWIDNKVVEISGTSYEPSGEFRWTGNGRNKVPDSFFNRLDVTMMAQTSILCSTANLFAPSPDKKHWAISGDPTEGALLVLAGKANYSTAQQRETYPLLKRFPFESIRKRMSSIHAFPGKIKRAFVKGSPKEMLSLCNYILINQQPIPINESHKKELSNVIDSMARDGLRILALAYRDIEGQTDLNKLTNEDVERDLTFIGITAMYDPPRPEVEGAISLCREAGIRVVMITGDYEITALSIARHVGIVTSEKAKVITGTALAAMSDDQLVDELKNEVVFARVNPEHKFRIVKAFKSLGNIVAVTGDGVNDAPALKRADIGIAMGVRGTDVAKEAADMILSDDNFASIVAGIEEGRAVFDNIRKFITYIFAHLVPEVVPFGVFALFRTPVPITPLQILAIDLGTETLPALALGTEKPEKGIMNLPPRSKSKGLIDKSVLIRGYAWLGILNAVFVLIAYFWVLFRGGWQPGMQLEVNELTFTDPLHLQATTIVFVGIIVLQFANLLTIRSEKYSIFHIGFFSNKLIFWGIGFALVFTAALIYIPFFQKIFNTTGLGIVDWVILFLFSALIFLIEEFRKYVFQKQWMLQKHKKKMHLKAA
ncbi:MAG TPA: HAD-IC family P-type ATPase [Chitinispirillaceae bacterium]|nr:HAD-IC family P-type ATPase [Chitinispirillaceae bacterium]